MCTSITSNEFRKKVASASGNKTDLVTLYLKTVGAVSDGNDGKINLVTDIDIIDRSKKLVAKINDGDLAWVFNQGFVVVLDTHPRANNDGHHCRVIKVKMNEDGKYSIDSTERTVVVSDADLLRIRHTSFDLQAVNDLTQERYKLYIRLAELNEQIEAIREGDITHG